MPVSAEGLVEHQKLNQTALSFGWGFGVQIDLLEKSISANAEKSLIPSLLSTSFMDSP